MDYRPDWYSQTEYCIEIPKTLTEGVHYLLEIFKDLAWGNEKYHQQLAKCEVGVSLCKQFLDDSIGIGEFVNIALAYGAYVAHLNEFLPEHLQIQKTWRELESYSLHPSMIEEYLYME